MTKFNGFLGDYSGIKDEEVIKLQQKYGFNELSPEKKETFFGRIISIFKEPMFLLLICTSMLYFILGEPKDGITMIIFVVFMASINIFQEWRTDKKTHKDLCFYWIRTFYNGYCSYICKYERTYFNRKSNS